MNRWTNVGMMRFARYGHVATRLADGTILITNGGQDTSESYCVSPTTAELFDPVAGDWRHPSGSATLTVEVEGPGGDPSCAGSYPLGTVVNLPVVMPIGSGYITPIDIAIDGHSIGWPQSFTMTIDSDHRVRVRFAVAPIFADDPDGADGTAIKELAARGIVRGYGDGNFGTGDQVLRAQMAAMLARSMNWDSEDWGTPFPDRGEVDADLWRNVGTLAHYGVARGYPDGTYGPINTLAHVQMISFIHPRNGSKGILGASAR